MRIKTYAVNRFDAWLNTEGDDISGSYVKYKDHQEALAVLQSALDAQSARSDALAAELARYSMPAGEADQRMAESRAVRQALGFGQDDDDVAPVDLVERINALAAERDAVNADNVYLRDQVLCWARECDRITYTYTNKLTDAHQSEAEQELANTLPAADAWVNEQRAAGVKMFADFWEENCRHNDTFIGGEAKKFAAQIRGGRV